MIAVMSLDLHVVRAGRGPRVLFIHGSAADHTTWAIQLRSSLREQFELIAYDRRRGPVSVEEHAGDAADLIGEDRGIVVGSSFGAVIALELARTRPSLLHGAVLIEPPMAASDELASAPAAFFAEFDHRVAVHGGSAAGEYFLRMVLGDAAFERMPRAFQEIAASRWAEIRADSQALVSYKTRYGQLAAVEVPILLLGGARSASYFAATLDALERSLPHVRRELVPGAGHMLHAEAPRKFADQLAGFAAQVLPQEPGGKIE
jgi:pimeloyl-ACP methyl ester carboxylesterase